MDINEATEWVYSQDEASDQIDADALDAAFTALYGRQPDASDREAGLWSLCCAATPNCGTRPVVVDVDLPTEQSYWGPETTRLQAEESAGIMEQSLKRQFQMHYTLRFNFTKTPRRGWVSVEGDREHPVAVEVSEWIGNNMEKVIA